MADSKSQLLKLIRAVEPLVRRRGWQARLAVVLGVSPSYFSKLRRGHLAPGPDVLARLKERWPTLESYFQSDEEPSSDVVGDIAELVTKREERRIPVHKASADEPGYRPAIINAHRRALQRVVATDRPGMGAPTVGMTVPPESELAAFVDELMEVDFLKWLVGYQLHRAGLPSEAPPMFMPSMVFSTFLQDMARLVSWIRVHPEEPIVFDLLSDAWAATKTTPSDLKES